MSRFELAPRCKVVPEPSGGFELAIADRLGGEVYDLPLDTRASKLADT